MVGVVVMVLLGKQQHLLLRMMVITRMFRGTDYLVLMVMPGEHLCARSEMRDIPLFVGSALDG